MVISPDSLVVRDRLRVDVNVHQRDNIAQKLNTQIGVNVLAFAGPEPFDFCPPAPARMKTQIPNQNQNTNKNNIKTKTENTTNKMLNTPCRGRRPVAEGFARWCRKRLVLSTAKAPRLGPRASDASCVGAPHGDGAPWRTAWRSPRIAAEKRYTNGTKSSKKLQLKQLHGLIL